MDYQIITDSSCDLPNHLVEAFHVVRVPFYVSFNGMTYAKENIDITPVQFYQKLHEEKNLPKTSLPSIQDYMDIFEPFLKQGIDILCFCLTKKFSGSYQSAVNAQNILAESYPERKIYIIDSISATAGEGLLVYEACRMKEAGMTIDEVCEKVEQLKHTSKINFTVDSLEHLQKGGRIGKAASLAGSILNIKPIMVLEKGELYPASKVRGRKKAFKTLVEMTQNELGANKDEYQIVLLHGENPSSDDEMHELLQEAGLTAFPEGWYVGVTIGVHAGPTPTGIAYIKKYEYL